MAIDPPRPVQTVMGAGVALYAVTSRHGDTVYGVRIAQARDPVEFEIGSLEFVG